MSQVAEDAQEMRSRGLGGKATELGGHIQYRIIKFGNHLKRKQILRGSPGLQFPGGMLKKERLIMVAQAVFLQYDRAIKGGGV